MAKNIIFCADGTWNNSGTETENKVDAVSNVLKLFAHLAGVPVNKTEIRDLTGNILELEKSHIIGTEVTQIAKYINGVGNSSFKINRALGGAFGFGLIERIARGYTFISRNYEVGDQIYIIGFSRGAYTARALAGLICAKGLLKKKFEQGDAESYDMAQRAWYQYRSDIPVSNYKHKLQNLLTAFTSLQNFVLQNTLGPSDFISGVTVNTVAVWDTVGSLGIPDFEFDDKRAEVKDAFSFADLNLSNKVANGLHALALDEMRLLFTPTLWNKRTNIKQVVFPGAHSDVGGGYVEAGLSDGALVWMINELKALNVAFAPNLPITIAPNALAVAHKPWGKIVKAVGQIGERIFADDGSVTAHQSLLDRRMQMVEHDLGEQKTQYNPKNWQF